MNLVKNPMFFDLGKTLFLLQVYRVVKRWRPVHKSVFLLRLPPFDRCERVV
jgi:hypothetical protein